MHPIKRRRTEQAASTLGKPFRSPLHVDSNKDSPSKKQDDHNLQATQSTPPTKRSPVEAIHSSPPPTTKPSTSPGLTQQHTKLSFNNEFSPTQSPLYDPEYRILQRQYNALLLEHKNVSASYDTVEQALKIARSHKNHELHALIQKWRAASRDAAENLFTTAKDQVDRMGGVGVWRDRYMKPREQGTWNAALDIDEDELTEEQKDQLKYAREDARIEAEKYGLHQISSPTAEDNDVSTPKHNGGATEKAGNK